MIKFKTKKTAKIELPKASKRHAGDTSVMDIKPGDTYAYDGVTEKCVGPTRETEECAFINCGKYERKFLKDSYVNLEN